MNYNYIRKFIEYNWARLGFELLVVFLGVTAAFVLNNWQNTRQESKLEKIYITGFLNDVNYNIEQLESANYRDSIWLKIAKNHLTAFQERKIEMDSALYIMDNIRYIYKLSARKETYLDIVGSGNLKIIRNFNLRTELINYYLSLEAIEFIDNFFYQYINEFVAPFRIKEYDELKKKFANPEIIYTIQFSNICFGYYGKVQIRNTYYKKYLEMSYALRESLMKNQ